MPKINIPGLEQMIEDERQAREIRAAIDNFEIKSQRMVVQEIADRRQAA